jgi:putative polyhydroxyalkanoate system protein
MADISYIQPHDLSLPAARAAAQRVVDRLAGEFGLQCRWEGDELRFERSGVKGALRLVEREAALHMELGFLMGAFAPMIRDKVAEQMQKTFAS